MVHGGCSTDVVNCYFCPRILASAEVHVRRQTLSLVAKPVHRLVGSQIPRHLILLDQPYGVVIHEVMSKTTLRDKYDAQPCRLLGLVSIDKVTSLDTNRWSDPATHGERHEWWSERMTRAELKDQGSARHSSEQSCPHLSSAYFAARPATNTANASRESLFDVLYGVESVPRYKSYLICELHKTRLSSGH